MSNKNYKTFEIKVGGRDLIVEIGRFAEFANGSVFVKYGLTNVLVTVTASHEPREGIDFFPLSVDYEERLYSVGKIPGGFIKREGRPTEKAILTARLIDRPLRPLFPKDYRNDVSVVATVLSVDQDCSPEFASIIGASISLAISDIPFLEIVSGVTVGLINNKFVLNPGASQKEISDLNLTVASTKNKIMMIEAGANQVNDDDMLEAILFAHEENKKIIDFIEKIVCECGKEKSDYVKFNVPDDFYDLIKNLVAEKEMADVIFTDSKLERGAKLEKLVNDVKEKFNQDETLVEINSEWEKLLPEAIFKYEKEVLRKSILNEGKRPDGRNLNQIRELSAEIDILSRTHGSAVFKRGQTQVLTITTLGSMSDAQVLDGLEILEENKRYMHHYNFPSFSVGETRPSRGPGRREIGHGALAERALLPVIPSEDEFPYAIRLVSEVLSSNGSTSQASVCASSLSLMSAGVPIKSAVAGISIGLITDETEDKFVLLTDIQGLEDFCGDMDFKVAGTKKGITAIQMDIKIHGLTIEILEQAFLKAREARNYILDEIMNKCISAPRKKISQYAPQILKMKIDVEKMADVIGAKGRVIKKIIEDSGVDKIDTEDDGRIFIVSPDAEKVEAAFKMIKSIVIEPEPGQIYSGTVTRIASFGAFVEFAFEKEGLVHISNLALKRVKNVEDVVKVGDKILVKIINIDEQGRINLSRKDALLDQNKKVN
ncbi:MAG: polyribonucleotide nucleotidyltransferase [Firmicutes bacterium]|nr:polyribonucleotide nucleotidyltransferase [Bacillota bacterium]